MTTELELIHWFQRRLPRSNRVLVDSGDDAAVVRTGASRLIFKIDSVVDGTHFRIERDPPYWIGWKAMARPLSDFAAMAALPRFGVAAFAVPKSVADRDIKKIFRGMNSCARRFGTRIVGGDMAATRGAMTISVSVVGDPGGIEPVTRSGARPGETIFVTGRLGNSIFGKHLRFVPKIREARKIAATERPGAMIDISDGLAIDLWRVCEASGVGATIEAVRIPLSKRARLRNALFDGEDYELLFTARSAPKFARAIGTVTRERRLLLKAPGGRLVPLRPAGYLHRFSNHA